MKTIQKKEIYTHPLSDEIFESEQECQKDYEAILEEKNKEEKAEAEKEYRANYIRLNAGSVEEIRDMIEKYSREWWGVNIKFTEFRFNYTSNQSITHGAPIGVETDWGCKRGEIHPGFYGRISGKMKKRGDLDGITRVFATWGNLINAFHTGTGCSGLDFDIGAYFFIQDYPLIAAKHNEWLEFKKNHLKEVEECRVARKKYEQMVENTIDNTPEIIMNREEISNLEAKINKLNKRNSQIRENIEINNPFNFDSKYPADGLPDSRKMFGGFNDRCY